MLWPDFVNYNGDWNYTTRRVNKLVIGTCKGELYAAKSTGLIYENKAGACIRIDEGVWHNGKLLPEFQHVSESILGLN